MFGKLLKYEFKTTSKWYLLITLIALGLSVITGVIGGSATNGFVDMETNSMQICGSFSSESLLPIPSIFEWFYHNYCDGRCHWTRHLSCI